MLIIACNRYNLLITKPKSVHITPATTTAASVMHRRVQPTGYMHNELEPYCDVRAKYFHVRLTKSSSTLPRAVHMEGGVIGRHQCHHLILGKCSSISRHATNPSWLCPACLTTTTSTPAPTQPTIAMTNYTHAPTVINSFVFHAQL